MRKKAAYFLCFIVWLSLAVYHNTSDSGRNNTPAIDSGDDSLALLLQTRGEGYQLGTNCDLQGDVVVHLFFVNDEESQWDQDTVAQITDKQILLGLDFLEKEAARYGVALNFSVESHTTGSKTGTPIIYEGKISKSKEHTVDIPSKIAGQFGYESGGEMYADLQGPGVWQETIWLFLVNKDGVSYARKQYEGDFYHPTLEFGVIFERYLDKEYGLDDNTHCAATVAHEILHLYGAIDMYTPVEVEKLLKPIYPRDIMLMDYHHIADMAVGPYTAYSVGWTSQAPTVPS